MRSKTVAAPAETGPSHRLFPYEGLLLCVDCAHYRPDEEWHTDISKAENARCARTVSPVHGKPDRLCRFMRDDPDACGPEGRLWEMARPSGRVATREPPPWWKRLGRGRGNR